MLDRHWIAAHVPQRGSMCLLDEVLTWDGAQLHARASSHRAISNPLRAHGRLGAAAGIEYAAQAMALHGALLTDDGQPLGVGYLASVRGVRLLAGRLDDIAGPLDVRVTHVSGDCSVILYAFELAGDGRILLEGRASVVLDASLRP